jgi:hypothetical protein
MRRGGYILLAIKLNYTGVPVAKTMDLEFPIEYYIFHLQRVMSLPFVSHHIELLLYQS